MHGRIWIRQKHRLLIISGLRQEQCTTLIAIHDIILGNSEDILINSDNLKLKTIYNNYIN